LPARIVEPEEIAALEPAVDSRPFVGALFGPQGHLDGAALTVAFVNAARRLGAEVREHTPVLGFDLEGGRITAVQTPLGALRAAHFVLAAGAWTRPLAALADIDLPVYHIHGEALATTPLPPTLRCMVMVARPNGHAALEQRVAAALADGADWERWDDDTEAQDVSVVQLKDGRVLLGQVSRALPGFDVGLRPTAMERILREAAQVVPALADVPVQYAWIAPVPFTPDQQPLLGLAPGYANLYVCAGFKSALITAPVACEWLASQIVGDGNAA
jgi:glycine/D-amino acid oxidase-like deaminating enzyme